MKTGSADRRLWLALVAWVVIAIAAHWGHPPLYDSDDMGQYLSHARALADGRVYTDIGFLFTPYNRLIGPLAEPPGLPLLSIPLLGAGRVFNTTGAFLVLALCLVALALVHAKVFSRFDGPVVGTVSAAWAAAALQIAHATDTWLSDVPFILLVWTVIVAADSDEVLSGRRLTVMAVAGAAAFLLRMAALPLIPALLAWATTRVPKDRRRLAVVGGVWIVVAWLVIKGLPSSGALLDSITVDAMVERARARLTDIRYGVFDGWLHPFAARLPNLAWSLAGAGLAGVGLVSLGRQLWTRFAFWFFAGYGAMLLLMPTGSGRYMWPAYGLLAWLLVRGGAAVARSLQRPRLAALTTTVAAVAAIAAARNGPQADVGFLEQPKIAAAVRHLSSEPAPVRSVFRYPRLLTWHTGIPAAGYFTASPDETVAELRRLKITHVVVCEMGSENPDLPSIRSAIQTRPAHFSLVATAPGVETYRFVP